VLIGRFVQFAKLPDAGVPKVGVTRFAVTIVGLVLNTMSPEPVIPVGFTVVAPIVIGEPIVIPPLNVDIPLNVDVPLTDKFPDNVRFVNTGLPFVI
jgi:hypothetical protein